MKKQNIWNSTALMNISAAFLFSCTALSDTAEKTEEKIKMNSGAFTIHLKSLGKKMGNKVSNVNIFSLQGVPETFVYTQEYNPAKFVEYVQIMQATGGNVRRDLFKDPLNNSVLDDYKFDELIAKCRSILRFGAKPHIKTGNVPLKFCKNPKLGTFDVNVYAPDDYKAYYKYIHAIGTVLVKEFGREEVRQWRFGVLTEYENADWFQGRDGSAESAFRDFCKLYDCTAAALQDSIAPDICIGTHAMAVTEGLWDECRFIKRCGPNAPNSWTGKKGVKLDFVNASFYDDYPGKYTSGKTLAKTIGDLRAAAESAGLDHLIFGIDEGRILSGAKGKNNAALSMRITGDTWQAGYDARMFKICFDEEIDYFSAWGFFSTGLCCPQGALPSVSYHVANGVSKFSGMKRLTVEKNSSVQEKGLEIECVAGYSPETHKLFIMVYQFKNDFHFNKPALITLSLKELPFSGKIRVLRQPVDDSCNFFPQWRKDRKKYNIGDECFFWSPDDPAVEHGKGLIDPRARKIFLEKLKPHYAELARMKSTQSELKLKNGTAFLQTQLAPNGVLFLEISGKE